MAISKLSLLSLPVAAACWLAPDVASAANCDWTVTGSVSVDHEKSSFRDLLGSNSKLEGINVKVSARTKVGPVWGTWNSWNKVRTNRQGEFTVRNSKNCAKRQFKVQVEFKDSGLELRHETATSSTNKVKWYQIWEAGGSGRNAGTISVGERVFRGSGSHDLDNREARSHASIWVVAQDIQDHVAAMGSEFAFTTDLRIKYPHNSAIAPDSAEASYANPTTKVVYIHKSSGKDHLSPQTVAHELGHIWAYNHSSGEICLTETLLVNGNTHGLVGDHCVAFHEGFAEYFSDEVLRALYGGTKELPKSRRWLASTRNLGTRSLVQRHDDGWWSALHLLTTKNIHKYEVGTSSSGPSGDISLTGSASLGCASPKVGLKKILRAFNASSSSGFSSQLSRSETTLSAFFARVAAINQGISTAQSNDMLDFTDPTKTSQPRGEMCSTLQPRPRVRK